MEPLRPMNARPPALRSWMGTCRWPARLSPFRTAYSPQFQSIYLGIDRCRAGGLSAEPWSRIIFDLGITSLDSERLGGSRPLAEEARPVPGLIPVNLNLEAEPMTGGLDPLAQSQPRDRGEVYFGQGENSWKRNHCT